MAVVCFGYAFGIMHKVLHSMDWVIVLYTLNMVLVAIDLILYFHYVPKKHQAEASARANSRVHSISECRAKHVSEMGNNRLSSHLTKSLSSKSSGNA